MHITNNHDLLPTYRNHWSLHWLPCYILQASQLLLIPCQSHPPSTPSLNLMIKESFNYPMCFNWSTSTFVFDLPNSLMSPCSIALKFTDDISKAWPRWSKFNTSLRKKMTEAKTIAFFFFEVKFPHLTFLFFKLKYGIWLDKTGLGLFAGSADAHVEI